MRDIGMEREEEEGFVVVDRAEWWKVPFDSVSWSYSEPSQHPRDGPSRYRAAKVIAKPPHYHGLLAPAPSRDASGDDLCLSSELTGAKAAAGVLAAYEVSCGFYATPARLGGQAREVDLSVKVDEERVLSNKESWREMARDWEELLESASEGSPDLPPLDRSTSSLASTSIESLNDDEPLVFPSLSSPPRRLNAKATSFVPNSPPPKSRSSSRRRGRMPKSSVTEFTFPSIADSLPPLAAVKMEKDENGFYSGVLDDGVEKTPTIYSPSPSWMIPAPSRSKRTKTPAGGSRTRAIVDSLRSAASLTVLHRSEPSSPLRARFSLGADEEESDLGPGWVEPKDEASRSGRTKALFQALTRRRSASALSQDSWSTSADDDTSRSPSAPLRTSSPSPSPMRTAEKREKSSKKSARAHVSNNSRSSFSKSNDGWIEVPQQQQQQPISQSNRRSTSSKGRQGHYLQPNQGRGHKKNKSSSASSVLTTISTSTSASSASMSASGHPPFPTPSPYVAPVHHLPPARPYPQSHPPAPAPIYYPSYAPLPPPPVGGPMYYGAPPPPPPHMMGVYPPPAAAPPRPALPVPSAWV